MHFDCERPRPPVEHHVQIKKITHDEEDSQEELSIYLRQRIQELYETIDWNHPNQETIEEINVLSEWLQAIKEERKNRYRYRKTYLA